MVQMSDRSVPWHIAAKHSCKVWHDGPLHYVAPILDALVMIHPMIYYLYTSIPIRCQTARSIQSLVVMNRAVWKLKDGIVRCMDEECGKISCRWCMQPEHGPLKCNEVEKDP